MFALAQIQPICQKRRKKMGNILLNTSAYEVDTGGGA